MRLFVSIFLPGPIRDLWLAVRDREPGLPGLRWTPPESLHITLAFLGETPESRLPALRESLFHQSGRNGFSLALESAGVFPNGKRPSLFWIGIGGERDRLAALAQATQTAARDAGCPVDEREFRPHLTVARPAARRGPVDGRFGTLFREFRSPMFDVTDFHLVRSHLGPAGARYESLFRFPLTGPR